MNLSYNQKWDIFLSSIPFVKDSIEWRRIYYALREYSNKNDMKFDQAKLLYITILSLESILKAILIIEFPDEAIKKKTTKFLKNYSHNLGEIYKKIESWLKKNYWADISKAFSDKEKSLIKKWSKYAKDIKYKMDAFINHWLAVKWISHPTKMDKFYNSKAEDFETYEHIQWKLIFLWQAITSYQYWREAELAYINSLNEESTAKISNDNLNHFKDMFNELN